jgi:spermidine synthase
MTDPAYSADHSRCLVLAAVAGLGVSAVMTQLALMRELLGAFSGNELVLGISMGGWLMLTGLGTWLGRFLPGGRIHSDRGCEGETQTSSGDATPSSRFDRPSAAGAPRLQVAANGPASAILTIGLLLIAIIPLAQVVAVRVLRDVVFIRGAAVGVSGTVLGCAVLLLPFCLVSGALLAQACALLARENGLGVSMQIVGSELARDSEGKSPVPRQARDPELVERASRLPTQSTRQLCYYERDGIILENHGSGAIGRVYLADSLGSIGGGVLFSFALVPFFDHFALLCFPAALNLLLAGALAWHFRQRVLLGSAIIIAAGLAAHLALISADDVTTAVQHWGQRVVFRASSPYGRLVVTDDAGQLTFFENGLPMISTPNVDQVEETVHYAMSQRPDARQDLLISGGIAGTAREILRYGVAEVTYVELDPLILAAGRRFLPDNLADPRIKIVTTDARRFLQQTGDRYDVVIVDTPDPSTSQLNRFYTAEFYSEVRRILTPGGVLEFPLGRYENYVSPELAQLLSSGHLTARQSFAHVLMIPGGRVFFLASDGPLSLDIAGRLERRGLATKLVNRHYLDAMLAPDRLADLDRAVAQPAKRNTDFAPALYYYHLRHWLSQFSAGASLLAGTLAVLFAVCLLGLRAIPRVVFASGFTASALEVILLLGFQALYGSLYRQVGLVVTVFMAGLAAGAWRTQQTLFRAAASVRQPDDPNRLPAMSPRAVLCVLSVAIAVVAALLPPVLSHLGRFDSVAGTPLAGQGVVLLLTFALAALVGAQFPVAGAITAGETAVIASRLYTADFVGAALGALLVSTLLVPLLGATMVCLFTAALNLAAAAIAWKTTRSA